MHRTLRLGTGRAALPLLLGVLAAAPASAIPLLLPPLLSQPATLSAITRETTTPLLSPLLPVSGLSTPFELSPRETNATGDAWDLSQPISLGLASPWMTLRQSDPSLRFASWRQVFNVARLGVFAVPLRDDPAERTNIVLAAQAVDNATVAPGAIFSFNQTVGERTPDKGYQNGLMYSEGQLIRGTGGGICLVATGIYNAALQAGMGLLERHPHSGLVGYAPPGCDASIVYGSEDMQFQNTSDAPVVVKTDIQDDRIVISLYGQTPAPGYKVFVKTTRLSYIHAPIIEQPDPTLPPAAKPVVFQKPRMGFDVTLERVIRQDDTVLSREIVVSEHRAPRPEILRVPVPPVAPVGGGPADSLFTFGAKDFLPGFATSSTAASAGRPAGEAKSGGQDAVGVPRKASVPGHDAPSQDAPSERDKPVSPPEDEKAAKPERGASSSQAAS